jgi:hypothetical protein
MWHDGERIYKIVGWVFLKNGKQFEIDEEQSIRLAKYIMLLPDFKYFTLAGERLCIKDIDFEAHRLSKLPQQTKLDIRTKIVK